MAGPAATITPLRRADGSASYQCPFTGSQILGSVNGPIELPGRRDAQKPEEATVEVTIKPGTAAGGVGERYAEGILKNLLGRLILGREKGFPRRGIVVTLLIASGETGGKVARGDSVSLPCSDYCSWPFSDAYPLRYSLAVFTDILSSYSICLCCQRYSIRLFLPSCRLRSLYL